MPEQFCVMVTSMSSGNYMPAALLTKLRVADAQASLRGYGEGRGICIKMYLQAYVVLTMQPLCSIER